MVGSDELPALYEGMRVVVVGLQARADLNGQQGELGEYVEAEGRWRVRLLPGEGGGGSGKMLRPANLLPAAARAHPLEEGEEKEGGEEAPPRRQVIPGARVRCTGLRARPELNGARGRAVAYDGGEERWKVKLDDGSGKNLRALNLELLDEEPDDEAKRPAVLPAATPAGAETDSRRLGDLDAHRHEHMTGQRCDNLHGVASDTDFRAGMRVRVKGLQQRLELNGQEGELIATRKVVSAGRFG